MSALKMTLFNEMGFDTHFELVNSFTESDKDW